MTLSPVYLKGVIWSQAFWLPLKKEATGCCHVDEPGGILRLSAGLGKERAVRVGKNQDRKFKISRW